ncbi:hypothetical protein EJ07DRAFT_177929 [Lizonia empirigonia]|nr:hypothetical protein EJ07DRAFT_177929 [Lizonia empirigonia]
MAEIPIEGMGVNRFSKILEKVSTNNDTVTVTFRDGSTEIGSVVIGCDGSHSKVREFLVGHEAAKLHFVDLTMINFLQDGYIADEALLLQTMHPIFKIVAHPEKPGNGILAALDVPDPNDPTARPSERGQGLNNAIKDAFDLVDAIKAAVAGEQSLEEAITDYEAEMKPPSL